MLDNLKQLSLKNNELSGDIPAALGNLADTLTHLFLAGNGGLTGCVPAGLVAVASNDLDELGLQVCGEGVITPPDLAHYHPKLREAVLHPAPEMAGDKAFLADGELSESEVKALERAQSVFGIPAFYNAWELDTLELNEVQAALYMLSFYDPYTVVNDITADPADPEAEGARMTRALDDFGVYPGSCVYCKGQEYPREDWSNWNSNPHIPSDQIAEPGPPRHCPSRHAQPVRSQRLFGRGTACARRNGSELCWAAALIQRGNAEFHSLGATHQRVVGLGE